METLECSDGHTWRSAECPAVKTVLTPNLRPENKTVSEQTPPPHPLIMGRVRVGGVPLSSTSSVIRVS